MADKPKTPYGGPETPSPYGGPSPAPTPTQEKLTPEQLKQLAQLLRS